MIEFSFIVPVYNVEDFVEKCLDSLVKQKANNFDYEIIIVNDGSTDNSIQKCSKYLQKYKNIILINQINSGLGEARNTGIRNASGEYIICIDSDDYIDDDCFLVKLHNKLCESDIDVLCTNFKIKNFATGEIIYNKNFKIDVSKCTISQLISADLINISAWTKIVKRNFVLKYKIFFNKGISEDIDWTYRLLLLSENISCLNIADYVYLKGRTGSITENQNDFKKLYDLRNEILERCLTYNIDYNIKNNLVCDKYLSYIYSNNYIISIKANYYDVNMKKKKRYLKIASGKFMIVYIVSLVFGFKNTWNLIGLLFRK